MREAEDTPNITIEVVEPSASQIEGGSFSWSGVVVVNGERVAYVTHDGAGGANQYELCDVPDAGTKWAALQQHAQAELAGSFAPVDEFVGMLWADAIERKAARQGRPRDQADGKDS